MAQNACESITDFERAYQDYLVQLALLCVDHGQDPTIPLQHVEDASRAYKTLGDHLFDAGRDSAAFDAYVEAVRRLNDSGQPLSRRENIRLKAIHATVALIAARSGLMDASGNNN